MYTKMNNSKTLNMILCALFVALITIGTFIRIPIPYVPFTLQLLFTMLAGFLLGGRWGFIAVLIYIIIGLIGLPVFTEGGGFAYIFKPTFGYIIGFAVASYVTGTIANKVPNPGIKRLLAAAFIGLVIVYTFGMIYVYLISDLYLGTPIGIVPLFLYCFVLAVPGDIVLCIVASILSKRLIPFLNKNRQL